VSTRECGNGEGPFEFRSYRIVDGIVNEEEVRVVPGYTEAPQIPAELEESEN
jgi:hypothetical protein